MESQVKTIGLAIWDFLVFNLLTFYYYCEAVIKTIIPPSMKPLDGEIILITGSAKGIGRELCLRLASHNVTLICWDRNKNDNDDLIKDLNSMGCKAYSYIVDVSDRSQVETAAQKVKKDVKGNVTILINNAGIMPCRQFLKQSPEELEQTFKINVFGNFWTLREFLPAMIENNKGHIVTLCSAAGLIPTRNLAPYCGSKFAINGFIEGLKDEIKHLPGNPKINFTTIYPFSCNTGLLSGIQSHSRFPWLITTVLEPEDVADKLISGMRRNYEHIYVPHFVQFAGTFAKALLPKVQYAAADFVQCYVEPVSDKE